MLVLPGQVCDNQMANMAEFLPHLRGEWVFLLREVFCEMLTVSAETFNVMTIKVLAQFFRRQIWFALGWIVDVPLGASEE